MRRLAWAATLSGVLGILLLVTVGLFFAVEAPQAATAGQGAHLWGPLSDVASMLMPLPLLAVAYTLYHAGRDSAPNLGRIAWLIGLVGMAGVALLQALLIARVLPFEAEVAPVTVAYGLIGVWLVLANALARGLVPWRLAGLGILTGAAYAVQPLLLLALGGASFYQAMGTNALAVIASSLIFLVSYLGFPAWAIWLGRTAHSGAASSTPVRPM